MAFAGPDHSAVAGVFVFMWAWALLLLNLTGSLTFSKYAQTFPISGRRPTLVLLVNLFIVPQQIRLVIRFPLLLTGRSAPCAFEQITFLLAVWLPGAIYVLRVWILLFQFRASDAFGTKPRLLQPMIVTNSPCDLSPPSQARDMGHVVYEHHPNNWYVQHRQYISRAFLRRYLLAEIVSALLIVTLFFGIDREFLTTHNCSANGGNVGHPMSKVGFGSVFVRMLVIGYMSNQLVSYPNEGFGIKAELRWTILALTICGTIYGIVWLTTPHLQLEYFFVSDFMALSSFTALIVLGTWYPVIIARRVGQSPASSREDLRSVLCSANGFDAFLDFAKREFAAEGVVFWKAVEEYRKLCQTHVTTMQQDNRLDSVRTYQNIRAKAKKIMGLYIYEGSEAEINLSFADREQQVRLFELAFPITAMNTQKESGDSKTDQHIPPMSPRGSRVARWRDFLSAAHEQRLNMDFAHEEAPFPHPHSHQVIAHLAHTLFDATQKKIYTLLDENTFMRFRMDPAWIAYRTKGLSVLTRQEVEWPTFALEPIELDSPPSPEARFEFSREMEREDSDTEGLFGCEQ